MQWWQRQGLRFKLALGINLLVVVILAGVFFGISRYVQAQLWQREVQAAEDLNAVAATLLEDAMMVGHKERIQEALVDLGESVGGQIDAIAVYDDQAVLTSFASGFPGGRFIHRESLEGEAAALEELPTMATVSLEGQEVLRSVMPIPNEPRCQTCHGTGAAVLGDTIVHLRLDRYRRASTAVGFGLTGGVILIVVLVLIALYLLLNRLVLSPLEELRAVTQAVAQGDRTQRVSVRSNDELGQVGAVFNSMTAQLGELVGSLEERIADATRNLEAATEISHAVTSVLDPEDLQRQVVDTIRERFGLYYVGLFLLDEGGEYAVLRAGTGDFGHVMLLQGHKLAVGGESMIGQCVSRNQQMVLQSTADRVVRFDNPLLPDTRSELALPMRAAGRVIGAMTIQSSRESAFDEQYISTLQTVADQVAVAVTNARLFQQVEETLEIEQRVRGELTREVWRELVREHPDLGFLSDAQGTTAAGDAWDAEMLAAVQTGETAAGDGDVKSLAVPVKTRGQVVGVIDAHLPDDAAEWTPEQRELLEALAEQLGIALESAQLYLDAQRRAVREQTMRGITDRMRSAIDMDELLRTTIQETASVLGASRAFVQWVPSEQAAGEDEQSSI